MKPKIALAILAISLSLVISGCFGNGGSGLGPSGRIFIADGNDRIVRIDNMSGTGWITFGSSGSGVDQFNDPTDVAVDSAGRIYIADYFNDRIVRIDNMTGAGWTTIGTAGTGTGEFQNPYKLAIDRFDRIYVTDFGNNRIVRMNDMNGTNWTTFGSAGSGTDQFNGPIGIAVGDNDQIYVTDWGNNRVVRIDDMIGSNWSALGSTGSGIGQFQAPVDIQVDGSHHMLVTDRSGRVIQTATMSTLGWTEFAISTPQSACYGNGHIYIVDQNNYVLTQINNIGGGGLSTFGSAGSGVNEFTSPVSVRVHQ